MSGQQGQTPQWPPQQPYQPPYGQQPNIQPQWGQQPPYNKQPLQTQYGNHLTPQYHFQQLPLYQHKVTRKETKNSYFFIAMILLILSVVLFIAAHNSLGSQFNLSSNSSSALPANVGDTITVDEISCTVLSVQGSSNSIDPGWVFVHIKLVNNSSSEIHYYATDFHIKTDSGSIIDGVSEGSSFNMISGALAPGGSVDGIVGFILFDDHNAEMIWQPVGHSGDLSHIWKLGL